jgi:hypothetical protein
LGQYASAPASRRPRNLSHFQNPGSEATAFPFDKERRHHGFIPARVSDRAEIARTRNVRDLAEEHEGKQSPEFAEEG